MAYPQGTPAPYSVLSALGGDFFGTEADVATSKRLRFEVFKRDGFRCAYCGKSPPDAVLECDHIQATADEGTDDINNLITSCFDCNRGKSNISLTKIPSQLAENLEILKAKEFQYAEYLKYLKLIERRINKSIAKVRKVFESYFPDKTFVRDFEQVSLKRFLKSLSEPEIIESITLACSRKYDNPDNAIRYFCGICWHKIKGIGDASNTLP